MKFEEVLPAFRDGKEVRRKEWFEDNGYRTAEKALEKIKEIKG